MRRRALPAALLALALAGPALGVGLASPGADAAGAVKVTVDCYSNPETVKVRNDGRSTVTIEAVGSLYRPYADEPIATRKSLAPGKGATFQTGSAASGRLALTQRYIFNNDAGTAEGAEVLTSAGRFTDRC